METKNDTTSAVPAESQAQPKVAKKAKAAKKSKATRKAPKKTKTAKTTKRGKGASTKKASAKKTAAKGKVAKTADAPSIKNKAKFVRENPTLTAKELVAKAKSLGVKLTEAYAYNIRGAAKKKGPKTPRNAPTARAPLAEQGVPSASDVEMLLYMVAAEIGVPRAITLLQAARSAVMHAFQGAGRQGA
jgi:hypothetical protein